MAFQNQGRKPALSPLVVTTPKGELDLSDHQMELSGNRYLKVPGRMLLFRAFHPNGQIHTDLVRLDLEAGFAMFHAIVCDEEGRVLATGSGTETAKGFAGGYIEKAETVAIGRALAAAGFGTQFATSDFHDASVNDSGEVEGKMADAPVAFTPKAEKPAPAKPLAPAKINYDELKQAIAGLGGSDEANKAVANDLAKTLYQKRLADLNQAQVDSLAAEIVARVAAGMKAA